MLRLGIIGCGVIGSQHLRVASASPRIELAAVADRIAERRERAVADYGIPTAFAEGDTLIDEANVDAVVFAVPAGDRVEMPGRALDHGLHVLIEKPVAMNTEVLDRYIERQGDRVAACCSSRYQARASTGIAARWVSSGALGAIRSVHCRSISPAGPPPSTPPPPWRLNRERNAGGILTNWGCYDLDYLMAITGWTLVPRTVLARTWPVPAPYAGNVAPGSDAESHFSAYIACDGGAAITFERGEYVASTGESVWRIVGETGTLRLSMTRDRDALYLDRANHATGVDTTEIHDEDDTGGIHSGPLEDFAGAILDGHPPRTDLRRSRVITRITDAIYLSAVTGKAVDLDG